jgi:hypothetical protein
MSLNLCLKKKGQNTTKKSQSCAKIVKLLIKKLLVLPDNPCRAKKNTNNFFIGNFTILTQLCDLFAMTFFFNTNNFFISNFTILAQLSAECRDIIASITASPIGRTVIMYVGTFKTGIFVFISNLLQFPLIFTTR